MPEPQNSELLPGHVKPHALSVKLAEGVAPAFPTVLRVFPHQHSRPYSTPAYLYIQQSERHLSIVMSVPLFSTWEARRRPEEGSEMQP